MRGLDINGSELLAIRLARGITQEQLANLANLDVKTVRRAEQGKRLDLETISRLATALNTEVAALLNGEDFEAAEQRQWRELIVTWHRVFDEHDSEAVMACYHEDAVLRLPGGPDVPFGGVFRGKEEIRRAHEAAWVARHEPSRIEDVKLFVSEAGVTMDGEKGLYMPSGKLVRFPVLQVFTFRHGLIADHHVQFDTLEFAKQVQAP